MDFNSSFKLNLTLPYHYGGMIITSKSTATNLLLLKKPLVKTKGR